MIRKDRSIARVDATGNPGSELLSLAITILSAKKIKSGVTMIRRLAQELDGTNILASPLLSEQGSLPLYMTVMGVSPQQGSPGVGFHLHFHGKPDSKPPKSLADLLKRGRSIEWLLSHLRDTLGGGEPALCEVKIRFKKIPTGRANLPVAIPLRTGGRELLLAGAEYRAAGKGIGVNRIRWLEREDESLDVWLTYVVKWEEVGEKPWLSETDRSTQFALELL
jgi:hypothetical protein